MNYDTIIMGGGLAGLVCGIRLQEAGQHCAILSAGQSALHFSSGSFDLLNRLPNGKEVIHPLEAISALPSIHPYQKIGITQTKNYAEQVPAWFQQSVGVTLNGEVERNHYRLSPIGISKLAWMSFDEFMPIFSADVIASVKTLLINFEGFLDFYPKFIADYIIQHGGRCCVRLINLPAVEKLRINPTEMRATNIARVFESQRQLDNLVKEINRSITDEDAVVLPATFGLTSMEPIDYLRAHCRKPIYFVPPVPPSVSGIRTQQRLQDRFITLGGTFLLGDRVENALFEGNRITGLRTHNHGDILFHAKHYVLATGSFFSSGLIARPNLIYEPVLGADVQYHSSRDAWFDKNIFQPQPYMSYGIRTDDTLHPLREGLPIQNCYAAGSILSGYNPLEEGSGSGVAILTAFHVSDNILSQNKPQS